MNDYVCRRFLFVRNWFPDKLIDGNYQFISDKEFNKYCNNNCDGDLDKINAGCLLLFNELFGNSELFKYHNNINIVDYIIIWLSYMLSLKSHDNINNLKEFFDQYINNGKEYIKAINGVSDYKSYKDLIDKKQELMSIDIKDISKFYDSFILLCDMHTNFDENKKNCAGCSEKASQFAKKYKEFNNGSNNTDSISYKQILSNLLTDYDNFKKYCNRKGVNCNNFPSLPSIEKTKTTVNLPEKAEQIIQIFKQSEQSSGEISEQTAQQIVQISEDTSSSSSIGNKLFTVLSIFGAITFFLGISYKYSLFGRRKRAQKQYLREKIKNIKKRMNH
ncbi:BIR protein [Plasmodium berghei]|uniref:BIR protein n=4 Tax=Plasmodium berghei TaxID=5821 RepID=A0A509AEQ0_PLABA|eukprot:XP_034420056.1 BIR protein [Plasmodium berghei ANKA]